MSVGSTVMFLLWFKVVSATLFHFPCFLWKWIINSSPHSRGVGQYIIFILVCDPGYLLYTLVWNPILLLFCANCFSFGYWEHLRSPKFFWHAPIIFFKDHILCGTTSIIWTPAQEWAISSRTPDSFYWRWYLETRIWVMGVLVATDCVPLQSNELRDKNMYTHQCIGAHLCIISRSISVCILSKRLVKLTPISSTGSFWFCPWLICNLPSSERE